MAIVRYFWHGFIHRGTKFIYLQHSLHVFITFLTTGWKASYTISASIFVDVLYWQPYCIDNFISCVVLGSSQWFFHFGEGILIAWTHIRCYGGCSRFSHYQWCKISSLFIVPWRMTSASHSPRKHSCVLRPRATSILIQERCSSFVNMVVRR